MKAIISSKELNRQEGRSMRIILVLLGLLVLLFLGLAEIGRQVFTMPAEPYEVARQEAIEQ
jgi:hypothetical protein